MTKAQIRFLVLLTVALTLWRLFEVPAINEAVWYFLTIGLVPGTGILLPAETIIRLALGVFVVAVFLIFRKEFMAAIPAQWFNRDRSISRRRQEKEMTPKPLVITVARTAPVSRRETRPLPVQAAGFILGWMVYVVSVIAAAFDKALRALASWLVGAGRWIWRSIRIIANHTAIFGLRIWYFIEPFLRDFDHWLNVTVHKSKIASEILDVIEACWKELRARWQKADVRTYDLLHDREAGSSKNT
jgi:hypothetical protein